MTGPDLFEALFTARVIVEDALALERAGEATGFKAGYLEKCRRVLDQAIDEMDGSK